LKHWASGAGHPDKIKSLADVRATEARSAQITRPEGVTRSFQVSRYEIEPAKAVFARNLLSNADWRAALADEPMEVGPEVPLVSKPCSCACRAERLARAGACPDWPVVGPSGTAQGVAPYADPGEEVALGVFGKGVGIDVTYVAFIYISGRDVARCNQIPQPLRRVRVVLVIVGGHFVSPTYANSAHLPASVGYQRCAWRPLSPHRNSTSPLAANDLSVLSVRGATLNSMTNSFSSARVCAWVR
jgi:hypothetical protein